MEHISYKTQTEIVNFQGRESPLHDFFRLRLICGAADGIMKLSAAPFLFRKGAQNEQPN